MFLISFFPLSISSCCKNFSATSGKKAAQNGRPQLCKKDSLSKKLRAHQNKLWQTRSANTLIFLETDYIESLKRELPCTPYVPEAVYPLAALAFVVV